MVEVKAKLSSYRQAPRKVRLVADLIRGKTVESALTELTFLTKKASLPVKKLIESALANAKDQGIETDSLKIKEIRVDEGQTLYRRRPASRGRAHPIRRRASHISLILENKNGKKVQISNKETVTNKNKIKEEEK